ncbi:MAG TPA: hypothetical protein VI603_01550 [Saprospiraceae bacterium]|nr:hypothetical protein [Saprospiraceae bacterium]
MKKLNLYITIFLGAFLFITGCEQDRTFVEYEDLEHGAFPRRLSLTGPYAPAFNYNDVAGSFISFTVEFYDDNDGQSVESYCWTVNHTPTGTSAPMGCKTRSEFGTSPDGLPSTDFTFTFQQSLDALGLTIDDVNGGEALDFYATLTLSDGRVFDRINTSTILQGQPAFNAFFQHKANLICPSLLAGVFDASTTGNGGIWACNATWTGPVEWVLDGNGIYNVRSFYNNDWYVDMSMGGYNACYYPAGAPTSGLPNGNLRISDACGKLAYTGLSQWGEIYSFNSITVNGATLVLDWENDYGEAAITTLVRTDGKNWPANLRK